MSDEVTIVHSEPGSIVVIQPSPAAVIRVEAPGPKGGKGDKGDSAVGFFVTATAAVGGYRCMYLDSSDHLAYADSATLSHARRIVGVTGQAYSIGDAVELLRSGELTDGTWSWNTSLPVYLGHNGVFTQVVPVSPDAAFMLVLGMPISATKLLINLREPFALQ